MKRTRMLLTFLAVAWLALGTALAQPRTGLPDDARFDVLVAFSTGTNGESLPAMISALARSVGLTPVVDDVPVIDIVYDIGEPKPFRQVWSLVLTLNDLDYVLQDNDVVVVGTPESLRRLSTGAERREPTLQRFYRVGNDPAQVAAILERVVPEASIDTLPGNNAIIVVGTQAEHDTVSAALAEFDQPRDAIALEQRTFFLSHADASALATTIGDTLIVLDASGAPVTNYRVVADTRTNSLVVTGSAAVLERIGELLSELDTPEEPTVRRLYRTVGDASRLAAIVERVVPNASVDVLPDTNAFYVRATEADQEAVEAALEEFDTAEPEPEPEPTVRRLYRTVGDATNLAAIVERAVPGASVAVLPETNAFYVEATEHDHEAVEAAIEEFDAPEPEPTVRRLYRPVGDATNLAAIIERVVPNASVDVLPDTNAFFARATEADHEAVEAALEEFDTVEPEPEPEPTVRHLYRAAGDANRLADIIERAVPGARVDVLPETNAFYVEATEHDHEAVEAAIEEFDVAPDPTVQRLYRTTGDVSSLVTILERTVPGARVEVVPDTNRIVVEGTEAEHALVDAAIDDFEAVPDVVDDEPTVERIYRVENEPAQVATILRRVVPGARVEALPGTNALIIVATEANHEAVTDALLEFDAPEDVVQLEQRTYFLSNARANDLAGVLQGTLRGDDEEGIRLEDTTVVAEPRTNSLIVTGSAAVQRRFAGLIDELDRPQRQVNIQVRIQEITRSAALTLGIDWNAGFGNMSAQILSGGLGFIFDTTQVISSLNVLAVLDALESQGLTRRVDDSNITVVDAGLGRIQSGGTIFITLPGANQNIERTIPYGVQIDVSPRIAADGRITLDVDASVEDVLSTTADPTFLELSTRNVTTVVSVEPGQTVLLGGLLQNSLSLTRRQIPVLGSLPLVGDLFSQNITEEDSVDLLIILTAQIIE